MNAEPVRILVVAGPSDEAEPFAERLDEAGIPAVSGKVSDEEGLRSALAEGSWDLVVSHQGARDLPWETALPVVRESDPDLPFLVVIERADYETAARAMRAGAQDVISREGMSRLLPIVERELAAAATRRRGRRTEEELRATAAHLKELVSSTPAVIYTAEPRGDLPLTFVSDNIESVFGISPERCLEGERGWTERVHEEDLPELRERLGAQVDAGGGINEYRLRDGRGGWRWVRDEFRVERDDSGRPSRLVGYFLDITSERTARKAREETERRYRTLFERSGDGIAITTLDGRFLEVNDRLASIMGVAKESFRTRNALDRYEDPADRERLLAAVRKGPVRDFPIRFRLPDGSLAETLVSAVPWEDRTGEIGGLITMIRDVTQARRAERELRESEARFRELAEHIDDVFWISSPERDRFLYVSPAFERIWGVPPEELYRSPELWRERIHPEDRARIDETWGTRKGEEVEAEYRILRRDGSVRWIWERAFPVVGEAGEIERMVGVAEDITHRIDLEQQLLHSQKMEAIGRLAGGVAHDFNNLLTVIEGHGSFLLEGLAADSPLLESAKEIRAAARRASTLTRQLLAFSKRQVLQPRDVDLGAILREMHNMLDRIIGDDVELVVEDRGEEATVRADPGQVEQVILNLVVNAREAMPGGGRIRVLIERSPGDGRDGPASEADEPRYCALSVADTGEGIAPGVRDRIFEPFFTTREEGTGLGLATVFGIVEQSGGYVEVESRLGVGTTFTAYFPENPGPAAADATRRTATSPGPR